MLLFSRKTDRRAAGTCLSLEKSARPKCLNGALRRPDCWRAAAQNPLRLFQFVAAGAFLALAGCQIQTVSTVELEIHQAYVNRSGLANVHAEPLLHVTCAPPQEWDALPMTSNMLYTHQQWRSPDRHVGMGVAYMHTPIPFSPQTLIWFAKRQYTRGDDRSGRLIAEWTDSLGRCWFEAENSIYHVRGYAMTHDCDAWMVYSGYRVKAAPPAGEILLAQRGADSIAPLGSHE
jgi:hypothetical protein